MFNFYFAVTGAMIEKHGMPLALSGNNHYVWQLSHHTTCRDKLDTTLYKSAGSVLNSLGTIDTPIAICKAFISDSDAISIMNGALIGEGAASLTVTVTEMTWLNNKT